VGSIGASRAGALILVMRFLLRSGVVARRESTASFGSVVIPDGMGGFVHNGAIYGAIYIVDGRGRLVRILDSDEPRQLVAAALDAFLQ